MIYFKSFLNFLPRIIWYLQKIFSLLATLLLTHTRGRSGTRSVVTKPSERRHVAISLKDVNQWFHHGCRARQGVFKQSQEYWQWQLSLCYDRAGSQWKNNDIIPFKVRPVYQYRSNNRVQLWKGKLKRPTPRSILNPKPPICQAQIHHAMVCDLF